MNQMEAQELVYQPPEGANFGPPYQGPPQSLGPQTHVNLPAGGPPLGGHEQTISWQQGHYMGAESGFISASTTQPSSITGHEDDLDQGGGGCYTGPGSITGSSIYDLDSAHISEVSSVHSLQLGGPMGQDPEAFIPQLVGLLCDDDQVVVYEYLHFIEKCVRKEGYFNAYIRSQNLVDAIVKTLISSTTIMFDIEIGRNNNNNNNISDEARQQEQQIFEAAQKRAKSASNILRAMVHRDGGDHRDSENQRIACHNIMLVGGIQPLTGLLACNLDRIMFNAITTIHSILSCLDQDKTLTEAAKNAVRQVHGVEILVGLLGRDNAKLLTIITDCLRILASAHQPTKMIILERKGPDYLINILKQQNYKNLIMMTARLLKVLSVCPHNKPAIIQAGGMEALARQLSLHKGKEITYHCVWTMRNLSDVATHIENPANLSQELIQLLAHPEEQILICAAGIISNLTAINEMLKLAICEAGGIKILISVVEKRGGNNELLEPALCALRHLTNNHRRVDYAQGEFLYEHNGLAKVSPFFARQGASRACLKPVLGIFRNLAQKPVNHQILRDQKVLQYVLSLLNNFMKTAMEPNGRRPADGVRWEDIIETCLSCIFYFAKDPTNRTIIRDRAILQDLKCLVETGTENIIRLTAGILQSLTTDPEGAFVIQNEGLADSIRHLISSKNERTAHYATSAMYNMTQVQKGGSVPPNQHQFPMDGRFQQGMGQGFNQMMGNQQQPPPPQQMHPQNPGPQGGQMSNTGPGYHMQMMPGGPQPLPHGDGQPHQGGMHGFMDDFGGGASGGAPSMSMDIEGLMAPPFNSNFFDGGM